MRAGYSWGIGQVMHTTTFNTIGQLSFSIIAGEFQHRFGLRCGNLAASIILVASYMLRFLIYQNFLYILLSSYLQGVYVSFMVCSWMQFLKSWFEEKRRKYYTAVLIRSVVLGNSIGLYLPFFFINCDFNDVLMIYQQMRLFNVAFLCIGLVFLALSFLFVIDPDHRRQYLHIPWLHRNPVIQWRRRKDRHKRNFLSFNVSLESQIANLKNLRHIKLRKYKSMIDTLKQFPNFKY